MVSGEYAVLRGAPAVVAAVDKRAYVRVRSTPPEPAQRPAPAEARAAFAQAERAFGASVSPELTLSVDVTQLRDRDSKLGLGSSAAAAAGAAALAYAARGLSVSTPEARAAIFDAAFRGHKEISPQGSGADVAASVHGGYLRVRKSSDTLEVSPLEWPRGLRARVVWTGQEANTTRFLERVASFEAAEPRRFQQVMGVLEDEAERFVSALAAQDVRNVLSSTAAYGDAMAALGRAAGVPIVTDVLREVAQRAQAAGGAAKPSGAGGGDVALALFPDDKSEQHFLELCGDCNFTLLLIDLGAPGVRTEGQLDGSEATA
jgi:phosphomevalonate kinase